MTSIPSANFTPWISFGNWLWPSIVAGIGAASGALSARLAISASATTS